MHTHFCYLKAIVHIHTHVHTQINSWNSIAKNLTWVGKFIHTYTLDTHTHVYDTLFIYLFIITHSKDVFWISRVKLVALRLDTRTGAKILFSENFKINNKLNKLKNSWKNNKNM